MPIFKADFFSQFSFMPIAIYDQSFYDGLGFDPNNTSVHPFAKPFMNENSFFDNTMGILLIFVFAASKLKFNIIQFEAFTKSSWKFSKLF
jgi:hypothetical protein